MEDYRLKKFENRTLRRTVGQKRRKGTGRWRKIA
jgi:hypothetical protein